MTEEEKQWRPLRSLSRGVLRMLPRSQDRDRARLATRIELVDTQGPPAHVARRVYVNGVEVLVAESGVEIDYGSNEPTIVTLRLLPSSLIFRGPRS